MPWELDGDDLRAEHDRHARARRLHLRGLPLAGRLRGRGPARRRRAGHRGADAGEPLPGDGERPARSSRCSTRSTCRRPSPRSTPRSWPTSSAASPRTCLRVSGKTGAGVEPLLDEIVAAAPRRRSGDADAPARAMIFDSVYDTYRGVVTYVRVIDGHLQPARADRDDVDAGAPTSCSRSASSRPSPCPSKGLGVGEVGYLITGVKDVRQSKVGDTVTNAAQAGRRRRWPATATPSRWSSPACTRSTAPTTRPARGARQAQAQRRRAGLRAGDLRGAGLRLPLRLPRPAAPRDRPRAARARVRPRPHLDRAQRGLRGDDGGRQADHRHQPVASSRTARSPRSASRSSGPRSSRRATTSARSWSSASSAAARCSAWTTCPRTASRCATRCRSPRSSSTSSTS